MLALVAIALANMLEANSRMLSTKTAKSVTWLVVVPPVPPVCVCVCVRVCVCVWVC